MEHDAIKGKVCNITLLMHFSSGCWKYFMKFRIWCKESEELVKRASNCSGAGPGDDLVE